MKAAERITLAREYEAHGWVLVQYNLATKGPDHRHWNLREFLGPVNDGWLGNFGLCHAYSGTCAIDIDDLAQAATWLDIEHDVDLYALLDAPNAVQITSGQPNRAKLVYRLEQPLQKIAKVVDKSQIIDFRCASSKGTTFQDAIPPSMHPTGHLYQWAGKGHWSRLPVLPEGLRRAWEGLLAQKGQRSTSASTPLNRDGEPWSKALDALYHLDPDCDREQWVQIGMAFHAAGGTYEDWDAWSATGNKYAGMDDTAARWSSFSDGGGITAGTLRYLAREAGWQEYSVEEMFGSVPDSLPPIVNITDEEKEIDRLIDALLPGQEVDALIERMVKVYRIRESDTVAEKLLSRISANSGVTKKAINQQYTKEKKKYFQELKQARQIKGPLLDNAMRVFETPLETNCQTKEHLLSRYVYVQRRGKFYDRLTNDYLSRDVLDARYAHLSLSPDPVGASTVILSMVSSVKVDGDDYWPGVTARVFEDERGMFLLNTWRDTGLPPVPGDITPWLQHGEWLIPNEFERTYLIKWMSAVYRFQDTKVNHNPLIGGAPRIGKDGFFYPLYVGIGGSNFSVVDSEKVASEYQDWAYHKKLVVLNELLFAGINQRNMENKLKSFGAAPPDILTLRLFGLSAGYEQRNTIQIIANTNYRNAAEFETAAERWFCVWCPVSPRPAEYYATYYAWLKAGGAAAVLAYLHTVDLSDFSPGGNAPETPWRRDMVDDARTGSRDVHIEQWVSDGVDAKTGIFASDVVSLDDILGAFKSLHPDQRVDRKVVSQALRRMGALRSDHAGKDLRFTHDGRRITVRAWAIRNVAYWSDSARTPEEWHAALRGVK